MKSITAAHLTSGRGGLLGDQGRRRRWWKLTLDCGHEVVRDVRYVPPSERTTFTNGGRGWGTIGLSYVLPAPKRARCDICE